MNLTPKPKLREKKAEIQKWVKFGHKISRFYYQKVYEMKFKYLYYILVLLDEKTILIGTIT